MKTFRQHKYLRYYTISVLFGKVKSSMCRRDRASCCWQKYVHAWRDDEIDHAASRTFFYPAWAMCHVMEQDKAAEQGTVWREFRLLLSGPW